MTQRPHFDFIAFYKALSATVAARDTNWEGRERANRRLAVHAFQDVQGPETRRRQSHRLIRVVRYQSRRFHICSEASP